MSHYARALRFSAGFPEALERLAWIAATDPRPEYRNGTEAVNLAQRACELTEPKQPGAWPLWRRPTPRRAVPRAISTADKPGPGRQRGPKGKGN